MIARADNGGLGNLTWELCRHLRPARVLIMDFGEYGRSDVHLERYADFDCRVVHGWAPSAADRKWLLDGCDVLYSAETWYAPEVPAEAAKADVRTFLHVMPELFTAHVADELWIPTTYRRRHIPTHRLVPVPVALDRFDYRPRGGEHFVHIVAPAMLDRNGTSSMLAALQKVSAPIRVTVQGATAVVRLPARCPVKLDMEPRGYPDEYWDIWPDDGDVLILPRRYAGLSMPVQEAAARGMPAIMTAADPQQSWPGVYGVGTRGSAVRTNMAGGVVDVVEADPVLLAAAIQTVADRPDVAARLSLAARTWAEGISWDVWTPRYRHILGLDL